MNILGSDSLIAPMREIVVPRDCSKIVIECRPTTPDVNVTLSSVCMDKFCRSHNV